MKTKQAMTWAVVSALPLLASVGLGGEKAGNPAPAGAWTVYKSWPLDKAEAQKRQKETAAALKADVTKTIDLGEGVKMELVLIPAGEFMMGSTVSADEAEKKYGKVPRVNYKAQHPRHRVRLTKPFYMGKFEVTVEQFARFAAESGYKTTVEKTGKASGPRGKRKDRKSLVEGVCWKKPGFEQGPKHPVVQMSFHDPVEFCKWLSKKAGKSVTLATEAEWEYACRAGTDTAFWFGDDPAAGKGKVNWADKATQKWLEKSKATVDFDDGFATTAPVGSFEANPWGLHDMHGNAMEWVRDSFGQYGPDLAVDPTGGATKTKFHILRGGSWVYEFGGPAYSLSANRTSSYTHYALLWYYAYGFRVVLRDVP
ncbi:MAG: formylglycine-generating enzyme family protein [Planctomycetota bacterium]|jgi:formylglycine-generating enzyme required for sulfatase activity